MRATQFERWISAHAYYSNGTVSCFPSNPCYRQQTTEVDFGYIMKQFDARVYAFGKDTTFNQVEKNYWDADVCLQFQLSKQIRG